MFLFVQVFAQTGLLFFLCVLLAYFDNLMPQILVIVLFPLVLIFGFVVFLDFVFQNGQRLDTYIYSFVVFLLYLFNRA